MKKFLILLMIFPLFAKGNVWLNTGCGSFKKWYDSTGTLKDLGGRKDIINLYFGSSYDFYTTSSLILIGGAELRFSEHHSDWPYSEIPSSGFTLQNFLFFFGAKGQFYKGKLGFLLDLGPEPNLEDSLEFRISNTDEQHAIMIDLCGNLPQHMFSLSASFSYFLTFPKKKIWWVMDENGEIHKITVIEDKGDFLSFSPKFGYKFKICEIGYELIYRIRTPQKMKFTYKGKKYLWKIEGSNQFSIIPYLIINPPLSPLSFFFKWSIIDEYLPYGISLFGKNEYATRVCFTFGSEYKF